MGQVDMLVAHIRRTLGDLGAPLSEEETYEYSSLGLCVIDAVYSIGVRYESTSRTVGDFCRKYGWEKNRAKAKEEHTISAFIAALQPYENKWEELAVKVFDNRQRTSSRGGILKAEAVFRFAKVLQKFKIERFADVMSGMKGDVRRAILEIRGQSSGLSYNYFLMLAGKTDKVKEDRMISRFVANAVGRANLSDGESEQLVRAAAGVLQTEYPKLTPTSLDYLIWKYQRDQGDGAKGSGKCH
jgi:hypothetical protein